MIAPISNLLSAPLIGLGDEYRSIPRVSNSDLTRLKEEHLGYGVSSAPARNLDKAKVFGRTFHQHLLEPETIGTVLQQLLPDLTPGGLAMPADANALDAKRTEQLSVLMKMIRQDAFCRRYLRLSERERVVLSTDPMTGVACKARLDMVYTSPKRRNALIIDVKTTSARTQAQFLESCYTYDYDRQAAFYVDSLRNDDFNEWAMTRQFRFVFIGVMKQRPHRLFAVDATSIPNFMEYGRKKYRFWLRKWQEAVNNDQPAATNQQLRVA